MSTELSRAETRQPKPLASGRASIVLFPSDTPGDPPTPSIVRFTASGALRGINAKIHINPARGESFGMACKVGDDWKTRQHLTALGYDRLNTIAGMTFFTLPERLVDNHGNERPNPWIEQNEFGEVFFVRVAQVGFGRSATGNLVAHALTVTYDLRTYFAQDLWAKWQAKDSWTGPRGERKRTAGVAKEWGVLTPPTQKTPPDATHILPYHIPAGVVLWVDYRHADVQALIGEHIGRQKFAERNAITICRRNILKKFLGVARLDETLTVPITAYIQEDRDLVAMGRAVAAAQAGEITIDGEQVQIDREDAGTVGKDEVDEALAGESDEDSPPPEDMPDDVSPGVDATAPPSKPNPELDAARATIRRLVDEIGVDGEQIVCSAGLDGLAEVSVCGDMALLQNAIMALRKERTEIERARAKARTADLGPPDIACSRPSAKAASRPLTKTGEGGKPVKTALFDNSKPATTDPPA